jgi:diguanylate cyclase (GGDEF)-like protein
MERAQTEALHRALRDFALVSGHLVLVLVDAEGRVLDYNKGFEIVVRPAGDPLGQPFSAFCTSAAGHQLELVPGLHDGTPVPYLLHTWSGHEILLHAYPHAKDQVLLIGAAIHPDESQAIQRMSRLTTEMGNLVRELRRANQRSQALANRDDLTDLPNRRYFFERLESALAHARRHRRPLSVLMADLDYFKQVNDRFGHADGDTVLKAFARLLREDARAADLPGRIGGEEFALMLPDTGAEQACKVAERLRKRMAVLQPLESEHRFTVSIGVAVAGADEQTDDLLLRADRALYAAKEAGRDRVVMADGPALVPQPGPASSAGPGAPKR